MLPIERLKEFDEIKQAVQSGKLPAYLSGLAPVHKADIIYSLHIVFKRGALVLAPDEATANRMAEEINHYAQEAIAVVYPERERNYQTIESASLEYEHLRLQALQSMIKNPQTIVVTTISACIQNTMPEAVLRERIVQIHKNQEIKLENLVEDLSRAGYTRNEQIEGICQYSVRGGIVDFYPPYLKKPVRLEFLGDEIDSISTFSIETQRREEDIDVVDITPAREILYDNEKLKTAIREKMNKLTDEQKKKYENTVNKDLRKLETKEELKNTDRYYSLIYNEQETLLSYIGQRLIFVCELTSLKETLNHTVWEYSQQLEELYKSNVILPGCEEKMWEWDDVQQQIIKNQTVLLDAFWRNYEGISLKYSANVKANILSAWSGQMDTLQDNLNQYLLQKWCVHILGGTQRGALALTDDLQNRGVRARYSKDRSVFEPGAVFVMEGGLTSGYELPDIGLAVITTHHTQENYLTKKKKKSKHEGKLVRDISDLSPGDYVVHVTHGIGIFEGIVKKEVRGITKDYIRIHYAGEDVLYIPVTQLEMVSKYIGGKEDHVRVSKLNSGEWSKTRARIKKEVSDMAKELIELYAKRSTAKGFAFSEDSEWQREFEQKFEYEETDDQLRCIAEIKADMEKEAPMDRLLCGDVGFGKTEVALRAVFKSVLDGKQVAVLVPTTILAWQHYQTFLRRMDSYPVQVELLSRFRTPKQQKEIINKLKTGEIDVVIGTHRLIQEDVIFKNLGLCVIDEEQRFGVAAKEKIKQMRTNVDVLTLSATPIPRTMNMALSGIRDMSVIDEPPQDRQPVQTYVMEYDERILAEAIRKELRRGGQVFYLHNRVESIYGCANRLKELVPEANIDVGHGKMTEDQLSDVWERLLNKESDVLVCTTIIEAGIDVPNCNTLIIEDADRMGLSQLYQLRGRVGRSTRRAYAYFTFRRGKVITELSEKRLSAIREFTEFGSGFRIAMRDLEIRGAGDILGSAQHGNMEAVGYDLYLKMLSEAIAVQKGEDVPKEVDCLVDLQMDAHISEEYISSTQQRIDIYKKIADIHSKDDYSDVLDELIDRFGEPPKSVIGLLQVAFVRGIAAKKGIYEINQGTNTVVFKTEQIAKEQILPLVEAMPGRVMVNAGAKPYFTIRCQKGQNYIEAVMECMEAIDQITFINNN